MRSETWDKNDINQDHERLQALVRERRQAIERKHRQEQVRLRNWGRSDKSVSMKELFTNDKF